jgi:FtsZ-interacting cell division protein ZipA
MDTTTIIVIVALAAILLVAFGLIWWATRARQSSNLRSTFGSEYERTVEETGDRREAERELRRRQERVERLRIVPLSYEDVERYSGEWRVVQARFVDNPKSALKEADDLVGNVMEKRGYPVNDFEQRAADVSVDHPDVVTNYRTGHEIARRDDATTEEMRQAMQHYRALFDDLLQTAEVRR